MRNTRTRKARSYNPEQVKDAVLRGRIVEAGNGWMLRINDNDMVELWPPGEHDGMMTHLGHLDRAVADFCKKADMPIPKVNETQGDQVKLPGDAQSILGPDSDSKEPKGKFKPEVNERPKGTDQKGTSAPDTSLGPDSTSKGLKNFDPAVNKRPRPNIEEGGLPDTNLGADTSGAPTNWKDKRVRIQEDGRNKFGRRRPRRRGQALPQLTQEEAADPGFTGSGLGDRLKQVLANFHTDIYVEENQDGTVHLFDANFDMNVDPFMAIAEVQRLPVGSDDTAVWDALGEAEAAGAEMPAWANRRGLHEVKKPQRGPGQLGEGKAQMGKEAPQVAPGVAARRRAQEEAGYYEVDESMLGSEWRGDTDDLREFCRHLQDIVGDRLEIICVTDSFNGASNEEDWIVSNDEWNEAFNRFFSERGGRRNAEEDPFNVKHVEEPGKKLNKGENPSDPEEVISQSKGEKKELREETEGKGKMGLRDTFEDLTPDPTTIYQDLRRARPSEDLLRDIMDPDKWAANNIFMPSNQSKRNERQAQMQQEGLNPENLYSYIEDLYRVAEETNNDAMFDHLRMAEQAMESGDYSEASEHAEQAEYALDEGKWKVAYMRRRAVVLKRAQWALGDDSSSGAIAYLVEQGYDELAASEIINAYKQGDVLDFQAAYLAEEALSEASKAARRQADAPKGEGWERVTKELKKEKDVDNPYALANWMKGQGYKPEEQGGGDKDSRTAAGEAARAEELIEQWINGNRKDVIAEVSGDPLLAVRVFEQLDEYDRGVFTRLMESRGYEASRTAGPKLKENWGGEGDYGREISSESAEELHALTMALGGEEVDWSKFKPAQPDGAPVEEGGSVDEQSAQAEPVMPVQASEGEPSRPFDEDVREEPGIEESLDMAVPPKGGRKQAGPPIHTDEEIGAGEFASDAPEEVKEINYERLGPGKFDDNVQEFVYTSMLDGWGQDLGDEGFGVYTFLDFGEPIVVHQDGDDWGFAAAVVHEDTNGFVYTKYFDTSGEGEAWWGSLEKEYEEWLDEHPDWREGRRQAQEAETEAGRASKDEDDEDEHEGGRASTAAKECGEREEKEAVDPYAEQYYEGYMGDYGKQLTKGDVTDPKPEGKGKPKGKEKGKPKGKKPDLNDPGYKARKAAYLRARRNAQAGAPLAQPAKPPAPAPAAPAAPAAPGAAPGAPPTPGAPGAAPAPPAKPEGMPPGTGDSGLQTLGWTAEEIALMDEEDKKKILEIQLNKPGTKKKPLTPGEKPGAPAPGAPAPKTPSPTPGAPTPSPPGVVPTPGGAPGELPVSPASKLRMAKLILRKLNRRRVMAQAAPVPPVPAEPEGIEPPPAPAAPGAEPPATPEALPEFAGEEGEGPSDEESALQILSEVQEMEVSATTPGQVPSLKASYLARKLLTELGMTVQDAKKLYGLGTQKGLTSLFE